MVGLADSYFSIPGKADDPVYLSTFPLCPSLSTNSDSLVLTDATRSILKCSGELRVKYL